MCIIYKPNNMIGGKLLFPLIKSFITIVFTNDFKYLNQNSRFRIGRDFYIEFEGLLNAYL